MLDFVITDEGCVSVSSMLSDHFLVHADVSLEWTFLWPHLFHTEMININVFLLELKDTQLLLDPPKDLNQLVDLHGSTLWQMPQRSLIPLYSINTPIAKRHRRYCE